MTNSGLIPVPHPSRGGVPQLFAGSQKRARTKRTKPISFLPYAEETFFTPANALLSSKPDSHKRALRCNPFFSTLYFANSPVFMRA